MCEDGNQERADMQRQLTSGNTPVRLLVARNGEGGEETGAREIEEMLSLRGVDFDICRLEVFLLPLQRLPEPFVLLTLKLRLHSERLLCGRHLQMSCSSVRRSWRV